MNLSNSRTSITISRDAFNKLKAKGVFGESYTELVLRILDFVDSKSKGLEE